MTTLLSIVSLVISLVVAFKNFWQDRASIKIIQDYQGKRSSSFSCDGWSYVSIDENEPKYPDIYFGHQFRILSELTIVNKSAKPISIINFTLNNTYNFDNYTQGGEKYYIETKTMPIYYGTKNNPINYLKPNFDIPPYSTARGFIFFPLNSDRATFEKDTHNLKIKTSRRNFYFKLKIPNHYESIKKMRRFTYETFKDLT